VKRSVSPDLPPGPNHKCNYFLLFRDDYFKIKADEKKTRRDENVKKEDE
jgi:hypothetical protein